MNISNHKATEAIYDVVRFVAAAKRSTDAALEAQITGYVHAYNDAANKSWVRSVEALMFWFTHEFAGNCLCGTAWGTP